jgi:predicted amidophosphoribosyltransferase
VRQTLKTALGFLLDALMPNACVICGKFGSIFCEPCLQNQGFELSQSIRKYKSEVHGANYEISGFSVANYDAVAALVSKYKEGLVSLLAQTFAREILIRLPRELLEAKVLLVPIPSSRKAQRVRGFNPAKEIANAMAKLGGANFQVLDLLAERQERKDQAGQALIERWSGVEHRFGLVSESSEEAKIWLVDDVVTTGATLLAAKFTLEQSGYKVDKFVTFAETKLKISHA